MELLAVEFIEAFINHLCVDMSVLVVEVERLLLSVAESAYHFPVVGEPCAERLEVDAAVQLYNVPYLVVLHGEILQEFAQRMVPESACLRILEIAEFLECPHIDTVFFHIHRTDNMVAMAHSNNCTSDLNAWVNVFKEFAEAMGMEVDMNKLFGTLYNKALEGDPDCGGLLSYCYFSGEHMTGFEEGRPLFVRSPESKFNLANFMRTNLYTCLGAMRVGLNLLFEKENVKVDRLLGHGGLFKTKGVGQQILADAVNAPVSVMATAGEGGAWGIALLASYLVNKEEGETLESFLDNKVFADQESSTLDPKPEGVAGFNAFMDSYMKGLSIERAAVESEIW